jgi:hypothetical protein
LVPNPIYASERPKASLAGRSLENGTRLAMMTILIENLSGVLDKNFLDILPFSLGTNIHALSSYNMGNSRFLSCLERT